MLGRNMEGIRNISKGAGGGKPRPRGFWDHKKMRMCSSAFSPKSGLVMSVIEQRIETVQVPEGPGITKKGAKDMLIRTMTVAVSIVKLTRKARKHCSALQREKGSKKIGGSRPHRGKEDAENERLCIRKPKGSLDRAS